MSTDTVETPKTATKRCVLTDCYIKIEPRLTHWTAWTVEREAAEKERWANEFQDFLRDHRSQDDCSIEVERVYEDQCSACHRKWESYFDDEIDQWVCANCGAIVEETP